MSQDTSRPEPVTRRGFLSRLAMVTGLGAVAAALGGVALRYLYPLKGIRRKRRVFLAPASDLSPGKGIPFELPDGSTALVTDTGDGVVALSDVCPHLGCKVHYDPAETRFVCPCHNGIFDKNGIAVSGPPADEGKNLRRFEVARVGQNLFLEYEEIVKL